MHPKLVEYFLLNSVVIGGDHVINQLNSATTKTLPEEVTKYFMRGQLGQYKLNESIVGGLDDGNTDIDNIEYSELYE